MKKIARCSAAWEHYKLKENSVQCKYCNENIVDVVPSEKSDDGRVSRKWNAILQGKDMIL